MSDCSDQTLREAFDILCQNAIELNKLRVKRAVEEFDPENPAVEKGIDLEYIKKHLKA